MAGIFIGAQMEKRYAQVIVDISAGALDRPFTYRVPEELRDRIRLGSLVEIPFGRASRKITGFVIGFSESCDYPKEKIKDIAGIGRKGSDETGEKAVELAAWMKERYGSTMITALKTVLTARKEKKPVETKEILLTLDREAALEKLNFYEKKHQVARARLLRALIDVPTQPYTLVTEKLHVPARTVTAMKEQGVLEVKVETSLRNPVSLGEVKAKDLCLSPEQERVVDGIFQDYLDLQAGKEEAKRTCLLHGITGSGKTEVYIRIIEKVVAQGRQAIMLIPEISLTYQTLLRFYRHFGDRVSVMNSTLSEGEKADQFERARRGEIDVIIGPRSALFTPFPRIGIIVIDEEHEESYKNEHMPKYHARDIAEKIAKMHGAVLVLGSATPSLESMYRAESGEYQYYRLTRRLTGGTLPSVEILDMRQELKKGNRSILSLRLRELMEEKLSRKEQVMLFLNRRGFSGFVSCRSCGEVIKCPHCDVSLSLHRNGKLICHYCGYETDMVKQCPSCGSKLVSGFRAGTEQIEEQVKKMFPKARVLRMDADTTAKKGAYEKILTAFSNEEADILLGTQMIVKGHDFPNVTLMGILLADMSLGASDYMASERTFSLLTQAAGRAGRGEKKGNVVIQTYQPENYAIQYAADQDYGGFYREEIQYRKLLLYPPVWHLLAVEISSKEDDTALLFAGRCKELLDKICAGLNRGQTPPRVLIIGPAPASLSRLKDCYRYVVYVKCRKYGTLVTCKDRIELLCAAVNPEGKLPLSVQFDFDPVNSW